MGSWKSWTTQHEERRNVQSHTSPRAHGSVSRSWPRAVAIGRSREISAGGAPASRRSRMCSMSSRARANQDWARLRPPDE